MKLREKIILTILLAILVWLLYGCKPGGDNLVAGHPPSVEALTKRYIALNECCFNMELPGGNTVIRIRNLTSENIMGHLDFNEGAKYNWIISIDHDAHPFEKQAEATLIHEMCHQWDHVHDIDEGLDGHNQNHEDCMIRVAHKGGWHDIW